MSCPKKMHFGPCGGVFEGGGCEIDPTHRCDFVDLSPTAIVRRPSTVLGPSPIERATGTFVGVLRTGGFGVIAEVNGADTTDVSAFVAAARGLNAVADVVSITDHSGANVHMGNIAATAHLTAAGIEVMPTFACRDRSRIALQGDLLGAASLGARAALIVTGNHPEVGDSRWSSPVFDLDSVRLLTIAREMRDEGRYENGRPIGAPPQLLLGAAVHPFAPPRSDRAAQALRKVQAGADFLVSQHIFDTKQWNAFVHDVNAQRDRVDPFFLLGGVAILPNEPVARSVLGGLRGFTIPEALLRRLAQSRDPETTGLEIAAETVRMLVDTEGVAGCLIAAVTGRANALAASDEQIDMIREVRRLAGIAPTEASRS